MTEYKDKRDSLENEGTSKMSLAFAWGLTSARVIREKIQKCYDNDFLEKDFNEKYTGPAHYISELIWREFYKYLAFHYPELMHIEFQKKFRGTIT
jgi:deoxyribodipyrimidine photo-lyase